MKKAILVLEGGAMRSLYTSGVLDVLLDNHIEMECTVGVSAGALTGSNYISKQRGRTANINIEYCNDPKYIGVRAIKSNKGLVGFDYLFGEISKYQVPFDEKTYQESKQKFYIGATNCLTGKTEFFEKGKGDTYKILQASSSMPIVSNIVKIDDKPYLDGAIECNIPIEWAKQQGYDKIVIVLTRDKDYRKQELTNNMKKVYSLRYKKYPELVKTICDKPQKYNETVEEINKLEAEGKAFVIRPQKPIEVSRLEKDKDKLKELYHQGLAEMTERLEDLKKYLDL